MNFTSLVSQPLSTALSGGVLASALACVFFFAAAQRAEQGLPAAPKTAQSAIAWTSDSTARAAETAFSLGFSALAETNRVPSGFVTTAAR